MSLFCISYDLNFGEHLMFGRVYDIPFEAVLLYYVVDVVVVNVLMTDQDREHHVRGE